MNLSWLMTDSLEILKFHDSWEKTDNLRYPDEAVIIEKFIKQSYSPLDLPFRNWPIDQHQFESYNSCGICQTNTSTFDCIID